MIYSKDDIKSILQEVRVVIATSKTLRQVVDKLDEIEKKL